MSRHEAASCDLFHDRDLDVSEARVPTAAQREAITLLELAGTGRLLVRLSLAQWRSVDRIAAALARRAG